MSKYLDDVGVKYVWDKTKTYVDAKVSEVSKKLTGVYHWKGSVETLAALKKINKSTLEVGDVYDVRETKMNYGWTGNTSSPDYDEGWDALGGFSEIPTLTTQDIDNLLSGG